MLSPETSTPSTSTPTPRRGRRFARALRRRETLQDLADLDPLVRDSRGTVYHRSSHEALRARVDLLASQQRAARVAEEQRGVGVAHSGHPMRCSDADPGTRRAFR
jgi:hypothetical protein